MKRLRIFILGSCFFAVLYSLIFFSPNIFAAEETAREKCIISCDTNRQACFNINADARLCEVEYQNCFKACPPEEESTSATTQDQQEVKKIEPSKPIGPN
jgi:hypothetical protein